MTDQLTDRWDAVVRAVSAELEREGRSRAVQLNHDFQGLRLAARRPLSERKDEWITVTFNPSEVLNREPEDLAREFARTYYACS